MNIDELQQKFNEMRGKKWRTVEGHIPATISGLWITLQGDCCIAIIYGRTSLWLHADTLLPIGGDADDPYIEEASPYADWPMDAKIRVWNLPDGEKETRHFAGVGKDGHPRAWVNGDTSHTSGISISWRHAELAEDVE